MDLNDDVLIIILSFVTKKNDIFAISITCQHFNKLIRYDISRECLKILLNFKHESPLFFQQGKTLISTLNCAELTKLLIQLKECNKQQYSLKRVLISLQTSQHQRLFQRCVKLFSNKEFNRYYQSHLRFFASTIDQTAQKERYLQVKNSMIKDVDYFEKLNNQHYSYANDLFNLMPSCEYPLERFREFFKIMAKRNYIICDHVRLCQKIFKVDLTTQQIEESLDSFEQNVWFCCLGPTSKTNMIADHLGKTSKNDGLNVFELLENLKIERSSEFIFVCTLFPFEHVRYILINSPREWHRMLNTYNIDQLLQMSKDAFDIVMDHYEKCLNPHLRNEIIFMKFLNLIPKMKPKWLHRYLTNEKCLRQLFSREKFGANFYYFLEPKVIEICNQLENDSSPHFPIDHIALFNYLFDRELNEIDHSQLTLFINCF